MKKMSILSIALLSFLGCFAQEETGKFIYNDSEIVYQTIANTTAPVNKFYVIVNAVYQETENFERAVAKCSRRNHTRYYFLTIPEHFKTEAEDVLLEFVTYITDRVKLIDSKMILISDKDYTALYRETIKKNNRYKGGYLNDVHELHVGLNHSEICALLVN